MLTVEALLIGLDGTVYVQGAVDAIADLRRRGFRLLFLTNTDSQSPKEIARRLEKMGIAIGDNEILTCVQVGLAYIKARPGRAVCLMPRQLAAEFAAFGRDD